MAVRKVLLIGGSGFVGGCYVLLAFCKLHSFPQAFRIILYLLILHSYLLLVGCYLLIFFC